MFDIISVIKKIRGLFTRRDYLIIFGLLILFFALRLINLEKFPIFCDEGIYINWAKVAWRDASWRFISLTDGRQPLQTWATIPFLKLLPDQALLAGRLFAVFSGLFTLSGIFALSYYLFGKKAAFWSSLFYILTPYFLIYDRMALADSIVNGFAVWIMFFSIVLASTLRLDVALMFGLLTGMGLLSKSSMRLFFALGFFAVIYILFKDINWSSPSKLGSIFSRLKSRIFDLKNQKINSFINFSVLYLIAFLISLALYNIQRLSPFFHNIAQKNTTFALTLSEFLSDPLRYFSNNIVKIPSLIFSEMAYVAGFLGLLGLYLMFKNRKHRTSAVYIAIWLAGSYLILSAFARVVNPRYLLPLGTMLILSSGYLMTRIAMLNIKLIVLTVYIISISYFNYTLLFDPLKTPFPPVDRGQYLEGWPAGIGIKEIVDFAREKSKDKPVILIAEGNFGMSGDVLSVHVKPSDRIEIKPYWPLNLPQLQENQKFLDDKYVYIVFSHRSEFPLDWPIEQIEVFDKPGDESEIYLYELVN